MDKKSIKIIDYREIPVKEEQQAPPPPKVSIIGFFQQMDKKTKMELLILIVIILFAAGFFSFSLFGGKQKMPSTPLIIPPAEEINYD